MPPPVLLSGPPAEQDALLFDVSDLLYYLLHHNTLSGVQRVQFEILSNLLAIPHPQPFHFVALNPRGGLSEIDISALLDVLEDFRSHPGAKALIGPALRTLLNRVVRYNIRKGDIFFSLGAFWTMQGMGRLLYGLKNAGVIIGIFIHDIIPITAPEYFEAGDTRVFVKTVVEALTFADFLLTTSDFNKRSLLEQLAHRKLNPLPVHLAPLGHRFTPAAPGESGESGVSDTVAKILNSEFVLCVGTLEVRKNPAYLFNIWKLLLRSGRTDIPHLVFAGRKGWLVRDFLDQLQACNYLGGKIHVLHSVTDIELDLLYRRCLLTALPSYVEGWGLPAGESLAHGKICLCSAVGGIPEVGGKLLDYIDPYNARVGLEHLLRYLDHPEQRSHREREIVQTFKARPWRMVAEDLLRSARALARQARPTQSQAAIPLPANRFVKLNGNAAAALAEGEGTLSPELICISGWRVPELAGMRANQTSAVIRFRADAAAGAKINLVLRVAAFGRDFRLRIRSGSGAEAEALVVAGIDKVAVLPCQVEPGRLVAAKISVIASEASEDASWMLKGILYFDPKRVAGAALNKLPRAEPPPSTTAPQAAAPPAPPSPGRILLHPAQMDDSRRAASFGAFLEGRNCFWPSDLTTELHAPIFAAHADKRAFLSGCGSDAHIPRVGSVEDGIKMVRRSGQFVSTSRFSEGTVFDRYGIWKAGGYLQTSPPGSAPWASSEPDGVLIEEEALRKAPFYDHSCLIFYNGNLQNYYHWFVEGLVCFDILSRATGPGSNLKVILPKSMDIAAVLDHRGSLGAIGLGHHDVIETAANLIRVQEAIWVDPDLVQTMPAPYLKDFQQRISALYAGLRGPRNRRLLVPRKGPTRKIHNLEQVQAVLSKYDFETVYLEGMSIKDQILLFQSAEFIITPHGAGMANLLFCEPGTKVIELSPSAEFRPFFWLIAEKLDLVHGLQFCDPAEGRDFQSSLNVDVEKLNALIGMVQAHAH